MAYTSSQVVQAVPTGINSALVLISSGTLSGTSTVVNNAFSATYDAYRINIFDCIGASGSPILSLQLGATTSGYSYSQMYCNVTTTWTIAGAGSTAAFSCGQADSTDKSNFIIDMLNPFKTENTFFNCFKTGGTGNNDQRIGKLTDTTSYTAFTFTNNVAVAMSGSFKIYGYTNS